MIQVSISPKSSLHILQPVIISQRHLYSLTLFLKAHMLYYLCFPGWQSRDLDLENPWTSERAQKLVSSILTMCWSSIFLLNIGNEHYSYLFPEALRMFIDIWLLKWSFIKFNSMFDMDMKGLLPGGK